MIPMKYVIKLGGSIFCPGEAPDTAYVRKFAAIVAKLAEKHEVVVVVGGGRTARNYVKAGAELGGTRDELDWLGILSSRMNAQVLICALDGKVCKKPAYTMEELGCMCVGNGKIATMGGLRPKQTTDAVAVEAAREVGSDIIIKLTNVKGIYDSDPSMNRDAKLLEKVSKARLVVMMAAEGLAPGKSGVVDPVAAKMLTGIPAIMIVLDGKDMPNFEAALAGKKFTGTVIE